MTKADIARRIRQGVGLSEQEAAKVLEGILECFASTLWKGDPIIIHGFGKFTVRSKRSRRGRNPVTGEELIISPRRVVTFYASPRLKAEIYPVRVERQETITRTG